MYDTTRPRGAPFRLGCALQRAQGEAMSEERVKFVLDEPDIPTHWVNLMAD